MTSTEYRLCNDARLISELISSEIENIATFKDMTVTECLSTLKLMTEFMLCRAYESMLKNFEKCTKDAFPEIGVHEGFEYLYGIYSERLGEMSGPDFEDLYELRFTDKVEITITFGSDEASYDSIEEFIFSTASSGLWILIETIKIKWKDDCISGFTSFDSTDIQSVIKQTAL